MKAVMKSVSPRICEKIANGDCTILVSKTAPKCEVPFKCYIYCTKSGENIYGDSNVFVTDSLKRLRKSHTMEDAFEKQSGLTLWNGKVIGEFICDKVEVLFNTNGNPENYMTDILPTVLQKTALSFKEFQDYVGSRSDKNNIYGLHISDLKIYDKPKELSEFSATCRYKNNDESCQFYKVDCQYQQRDYNQDGSINIVECGRPITRAPQSWCYVEEL